MGRRYKNTFVITGVAIVIVVIVSWFIFPQWRSQPGGIVLLIVSATSGVLALFKGLKDAHEFITDEKNVSKADSSEKLIVQIIAESSSSRVVGQDVPKNRVMHNIPSPDYGEFIGRENEIKKIVSLLRPVPHSQHSVITIDGIGGVGKSALALEIANRFIHNYDLLPAEERFDAIIWTSAKQTVLTADGISSRYQVLRTLSDIYLAIAITLQRGDIMRVQDSGEQALLIRHALTQQRTLVIIDNLETIDDENVNAFIREIPYPTKVIVTTRYRLDVAYPIRLKGMSKGDATKLINQECAKKNVSLTDSDIERLFNRTGGVPLAIVWSIGVIRIKGLSVEAILEKLGDAEESIARYCFSVVSQSIRSEPAYRILLALSLFNKDASRDALGQIAKTPLRDRDAGLSILETMSLIEKQANRFSLLPLTKSFVLAELTKNAELYEEISYRWIEYLKGISIRVPGEYFWRYISSDFYEDGDTILDAVQWCRECGSADNMLHLTFPAVEYLEVVGRWHDAVLLITNSLRLAESIKDELNVARLSYYLSWFLGEQGDFESAEGLAAKSLELYQKLNNPDGKALAFCQLSLLHRKRQYFVLAESYCGQAEQLANQIESQDIVIVIKDERAKMCRDQGQWEDAYRGFNEIAEYYKECAKKSPRDELLANSVLGQLGYVLFHMGNFGEAKKMLLRNLVYFEPSGSPFYTATLKIRLARAEDALGEFENAYRHAKEAVGWFQKLDMRPDYDDAKEFLDRMQLKIR